MTRRIPIVSVVTPFHNTAAYLAQCIESVLAQRFRDFEYLLVDNFSTDGSRDIAARYAAVDSRIRLLDNPEFVGQVENYNGALARIDPGSEFVKLVQADDALMPDCLEAMVDLGLRDSRIGIVTSFYLKGDRALGHGVTFGQWRVDGREICRKMLVSEFFPLGSPTTVMYRASIVRARQPFYALGRYHEDTEAGFEILLEHDLGFVHGLLSFLRTENQSISSDVRTFGPDMLDHLIILEKYGRQVLSKAEFAKQSHGEWRAYYGFLADAVLDRREAEFWEYHRRGLMMLGRDLRARDLVLPLLKRTTRRVLGVMVPSR